MNRRSEIWKKIESRFASREESFFTKEVKPQAKSPEEAKQLFRSKLTEYVVAGWHIEIENEFDAVISRKRRAGWLGKFLIFLILLFIWFPLALFYLVIVIIRVMTARPKTMRIYVDEEGYIQTA